MSPPTRDELEQARQAVCRLTGLQLDDGRLDVLSAALEERARALRLASVGEYLARLERSAPREEVGALAEALTVGETYFFRNANDLRAFTDAVLPARMRARGDDRRLRILSAGCSSGEEPYTLAMLVRQVPALDAWDVAIRGVDLNPAAVGRAREGRYSQWSLRQTPDDMRALFFQGGPRTYRVADRVRALVAFDERNLVEDDPELWAPALYDVVFFRNVMMYFARDVAQRVIARIEGALAPGGFLFLGHAETLRGVSTAFHLRHTHDTFYYQARGAAERRRGAGAASAAPPAPASAPPSLPPDDVDWMTVIRRASERVARLTGRPSTAPPDARRRPEPGRPELPAAAAAPADTATVFQLVKEERYAAALAALGPDAADADPDALVLRAVVLASSGDPAEAERVCDRVLAGDELNAEAHYVKALCREHEGDLAAAADHDHYALYLDPTFAMPRLHLGLLAKRGGDRHAACRELARALALLAGEDGSRILLLGGGFGRDALVALCRAELRACGEDG